MQADPQWSAVERRLDPAHPAAEGHFPGNPIIPGAVLLDEILAALTEANALARPAAGFRAAKFLAPVRPGDRLLIRWHAGPHEVTFEALVNGETPALSGILSLGKTVS